MKKNMSKTKLQTLKGFRDFLPEKMVIRNEVIRRLRSVFEKYGFSELQTPTLEYQEVLLGKYGAEAEKLMYLFEDPGGRGVGMRYDLTVPLARAVSSYPELPKPFKRYQIQPAWRAEKPQKGRYREFYQCDVDTVGSASPLADAEILAIISDSLKALGFPSFKIKVNSRQVLFSCMEEAGVLKKKWPTIIQTIDKLDKKSKKEVEKELAEKGLKREQIKKVFGAIEKAVPDDFLKSTIKYAKKMGVKNIKFTPTLARGLDYYTGPIFESVVEKPNIGSITGGGRFDKLLNDLGGPDLPATGTSLGLDRLADVIEELNLWPEITKTPTAVLVTIFSPDLLNETVKVANSLRCQNINVEIYPNEKAKLNKQLKYADKKGIPWAVIIGPKEKKKNSAILKNLKTGKQEETTLKRLAKKIK
jgi:histidyl-tRNA synthetase